MMMMIQVTKRNTQRNAIKCTLLAQLAAYASRRVEESEQERPRVYNEGQLIEQKLYGTVFMHRKRI
jgi:hypothetical protein